MSRKYALAILLGFLAISLFAQDFYDMGTVNNIQLFFTQTNWDQILDQLYAAGEDRLREAPSSMELLMTVWVCATRVIALMVPTATKTLSISS